MNWVINLELKLRQSQAFTLVELTVTIAIVGVMSSMALSQFQEYRERTNDLTGMTQLVQARTSFEALMADSIDNTSYNFSFAYGSGLSTLDVLVSHKQSLINGTLSWRDQPLPGFNHDPKVNLRACGNTSIFMLLTSHSEGSFKNIEVRRGGVTTNDARYLQNIFYSAKFASGGSYQGTGTPYSYYDERGGARAIPPPSCPILTPLIPIS